MDSGKIGVVTVLYNGERVLDDFFRSLGEQTYENFTLYVIDNHSQDRSLAKARALASAVRFETVCIAEPENWGVAKGPTSGIVRALAEGPRHLSSMAMLSTGQAVGLPVSGGVEPGISDSGRRIRGSSMRRNASFMHRPVSH